MLTEVFGNGTSTKEVYSLREIYINPAHVVYVRSDSKYKKLLREGSLPAGLDPRQEFTRISLVRGTSGSEIIVVGGASSIMEKLNFNTAGGKNVLRG